MQVRSFPPPHFFDWAEISSDVVRTRDPAKRELSSCVPPSSSPSSSISVTPLDIVVDVGGVYSPETHRYDHHQRGFSEVFGYGGFNDTKLSSAGLVYK